MRPDGLTRDNVVGFIADIFERRGAESYLGEEVTMSEHMLQGALLAEREGAEEELVAAALLHDIGHYTNEFGEDYIEQGIDNRHDEAGARVLEPFFPPVVTACVRLHVAAKRYLCATDPGYFGKLSPASVATLKLQGGPMAPPKPPSSNGTPTTARPCGSGCGTRAGRCRGSRRRPSRTTRRSCNASSTGTGPAGPETVSG
jgi:[1-hydroxy-2-(trimethylamino)ethyl]phosphonate dioxygenase